MLIRTLIVLLLVLNLGVAAWWISRPEPADPAPPEQPAGVARLRLLSEVAPVVVPPALPVTAEATAVPAPPAADPAESAPATRLCFSLGPFATEAAAAIASRQVADKARDVRQRAAAGKPASGYNVMLPPAADRQAAQAVAQRIGAAGFDDFLVIAQGEQANGIALGRYGSREAAQRRQAALQAAGFPAQVMALGEEGAAQWWLDMATGAADASQLKALTGAAQSRSLDCAQLR